MKRLLWPVVGLLSIALLASGLTAVAVTRPDTKGTAVSAPPLAAEPFVVTLSAALSGSATVVGQPVLLGSQAMGVGRTVVALELWDGGRLLDRQPVGARAGTSFSWLPLTTGPHLLHARGIAQDGKTARSAPVAVDVIALRVKVPPVAVATRAGERTADVAARLGVAVSRLSVQSRGGSVKLGSTVPARSVVQVEVTASAQPANPLAEPAVVPEAAPSGSGTPLGMPVAPVTFASGTYTVPATAPLALPTLVGPTVALVSQGCDITLDVTGTGGGKATVERATVGRPGFLIGAGRTGDGPLVLTGLTPGVHVWDVRTSDGVSSPVSATVPEACAPTGWQGDSSLINGMLTIPKPTDDLYLYLGVDDKPFVRIPASHEDFLKAPTSRLDISSLLPVLDGKKLVLEVWHRQDGNPSQFGTGTLQATEGASLQDVVGEASAIDLAILTGSGKVRSLTPEKEGPVTFVWSASSSRVTGVMWQVLAAPLTPANTDVSPYSLVAAGFSMSKGTGSFAVDTSALPRPEPKKAVQVLTPPDVKGLKATLPTPRPAGATLISDLDKLSPPVVGRFWVRVLPLVHTQGQLFEGPMGIASSTVVVDLPVPVKPPITFAVTSLKLTPGAIANPALRACIRVTVPWKGAAPATYPDGTFIETPAQQAARHAKEDAARGEFGLNSVVARGFYPYSGTYCEGDFAASQVCDDIFCYFKDVVGALVDFVGTAWDYIAAAYNGIINLAVTLYAKYNPICAALTISKSSSASTCEQIGAIVARTVISAVLAAYGLPPSLPTTKDLVAIAQGDLAVLSVELMKEFGIPCDSLKLDETESAALIAGGKEAGVDVPNAGGKVDACLVVATRVINEVKDQVVEATEKQVAATAGLPYFSGIEGFSIIPEPAGHLQPTVLTVVAVPSEPISGIAALFLPACELATNVTTTSGNFAPFKNARGRLHRIPTISPSDPLAAVAAQIQGALQGLTGVPAGAWAETFVMSTPSAPNLDVDSVYEGLSLTATVSGSCLTNNTTPVLASYGPALSR